MTTFSTNDRVKPKIHPHKRRIGTILSLSIPEDPELSHYAYAIVHFADLNTNERIYLYDLKKV